MSEGPGQESPQSQEKQTLLKRTSSLFGLLGGGQKVAEAPQVQETIAEEPGSQAEADEMPLEGAGKEAPQDAIAEEPEEQGGSALALDEAALAAESEPVRDLAAEEQPELVQESLVLAEDAEQAGASKNENVAVDEPERAGSLDGPDSGGDVVPTEESLGAGTQEQGLPAEPEGLGEEMPIKEALQEEPKKVSFDEQPQEIPTEHAPEEDVPLKKKSLFGGLFSKDKKQEEQPAEQSYCSKCSQETCVCQPGDEAAETLGSAESPNEADAAAAVGGAKNDEDTFAPEAPASDVPPAEQQQAPQGSEQQSDITVHEGSLYKPGSIIKRHIKERHFRLMPDGRLLYSRKPDFKRSKSVKLDGNTKVETLEAPGKKAKHPFSVSIKQESQVFTLKCDSQEERDSWASDVRRVCEELDASASPAA